MKALSFFDRDHGELDNRVQRLLREQPSYTDRPALACQCGKEGGCLSGRDSLSLHAWKKLMSPSVFHENDGRSAATGLHSPSSSTSDREAALISVRPFALNTGAPRQQLRAGPTVKERAVRALFSGAFTLYITMHYKIRLYDQLSKLLSG